MTNYYTNVFYHVNRGRTSSYKLNPKIARDRNSPSRDFNSIIRKVVNATTATGSFGFNSHYFFFFKPDNNREPGVIRADLNVNLHELLRYLEHFLYQRPSLRQCCKFYLNLMLVVQLLFRFASFSP